jgi:hypothetical protein
MPLTIAAIRTGHDPVGKLPEAAFHRQLDEQIVCPKCDATYNLIADFDASVGRHFAEESLRHIALLRKAVTMGHSYGHRVEHFESNGVIVMRMTEGGEKAELPKKVDFSSAARKDS